MKEKLITAGLAIIFLIGAGIFFYPAFAEFYNARIQEGVVRRYERLMENTADFGAEWDAVKAYNEKLEAYQKAAGTLPEEEAFSGYMDLLNPGKDGVIGIVEVPSAGIRLPIYHGTGENELAAGAGHVLGTSLPHFGTGVHTAVSGHSAYPTARLFTDLEKVAVGDDFLLRVLDRVLLYRVDDIRTVLPAEVDSLLAEKDKNYCTLITCTPYGINTHRLLVRGVLYDVK